MGKKLLLLFALLGLGVSLGLGIYAALVIADAPAWDPSKLAVSETSIIYDSKGNIIAKVHGSENRTVVSIKDIPPHVINAFLAVEDANFYEHSGIDYKAVVRAVIANITDGFGSQGFSTITQQLVKQSFLSPEKTIKRKLQEIYLARQVEKYYTKDQILEMYLNRIFFGHNAYGIQAAAQTYFGKDVKDLTIAEAAMLAGIPQAPSRLSPFRNPELAKKRRAHVLENMVRFGFITQEQAEQANADNFESLNRDGRNQGSNATYQHQYYVEYVLDQLEDIFGPEKVFAGGLQVYTALDPEIQTEAEKVMNDPKNFPKGKANEQGIIQPQGAVVILEPGTGQIKALVGGRGQTEGRRVLNRATQSHRQPGSAFKPIIAYGPALEAGMSPATVVDDAPVSYGKYSPKNYDGSYGGLTSLRSALTRSVNVVAVKLLDEVGIKKAMKIARNLGISTESLDPVADNGLSIALGGLSRGVTPLEMAGAYAAFANKGIYVEPTAILKVTDKTGKVIWESAPLKRKALKSSTAFMLTDMLQSVVKYGTGTRAQLPGWPVAGKTGTTNDAKDIWFAGYTPKLVGVVWIGYDQPKPMPREFGGRYPALIWKKIMIKAHEGLEPVNFEKPDSVVQATVCKISGKKPSEICPKEDLVTEYFAEGTVPKEICDLHIEVKVSAASNLLPSPYCPDVVTKVFIKRSASKVPMPNMAPTEVCTLHNPGNSETVAICTDPSHNGKEVLANVPGPGESGGCPPELVVKKTYVKGQAPKEKCQIPEHQVTVSQPAPPDNTTTPEPPTSPEVPAPTPQ